MSVTAVPIAPAEPKKAYMRSEQVRINRLTQATRFVRVTRLLLWTIWVIYRERRRVLRARERGDTDAQPDVELLIEVLIAFRKTAVQLGVLMIKLGQFLSSRADLLPQRALDVLSSLQDEVPPAPFSHVVSVIELELHRPVDQLFSSIEPVAAAAASLGQVHKATLAATGETVAVKVQRPHIDQLVNMDLSTIRFVIWVISRFVDTNEFIDLRAFYREFRRTIFEEIDYVQEAVNARRFAEIFADKPAILIPRVIDGFTSRRVLVLEWIDGIKVNAYAELEAAGIDRFEVAKRTVEAYFYQFFEIGFFHADPHPGNIFVKPGPFGTEPIVAFVDFGMVGSLSRTTKQGLRDLFLGFVVNNAHAMVSALNRLGFIGEGANLTAIERGVGLMMEQYHGMSLGQVRDLSVHEVAHEIEDLFYRQPFRIPAQFAFSGRAIGTLSGLATGLAPEFNLVAVAIPYAQKFLGLSRDGAGQSAQQLLSQVLDAGRTMLTLPATLERVLARVEAGQIEVRLAEDAVNGSSRGRSGRRRRFGGRPESGGLAGALVVGVSVAAGVVLMLNQALLPGWFCLGVAGLAALSLVVRR
ncbi:MAG: AarF/ABC1/UbiB kinase family protein [Chloroflexi bacterium]|nr:AarF/ABC1/UbiB kinase family protein [Chloroflexota bacterium]